MFRVARVAEHRTARVHCHDEGVYHDGNAYIGSTHDTFDPENGSEEWFNREVQDRKEEREQSLRATSVLVLDKTVMNLPEKQREDRKEILSNKDHP